MNSTDRNNSNSVNARIIEKAFEVLKNNRVTIEGHTFTIPSRVMETDSHLDYDGKQWLWDSAFHAMILASREPKAAMEELRSVFAFQHPDGFVPHMNYFRRDARMVPDWAKRHFKKFLESSDGLDIDESDYGQFINTYWSYDDHSDITQPPVLAMAVEKVFQHTGDSGFLGEMLPRLRNYYNYLHHRRDPDGDNLISIIHPWESGWDNSQRWDETLGVESGERIHIDEKKLYLSACYKKEKWDMDRIFEMDRFNVEPVDFNVLYALNMESLSRLCGSAGDWAGEEIFAERARATGKAVFEKMWDGGKYTDLLGKNEKLSKVKSAAMFYPMMLDGEKRGRELVEKHMMNREEFNTRYVLPTTSADHGLFDGGEYWRGNIWINVNLFVWQALQKLLVNHPDFGPARIMSDKIRESSFELLDKAGFFEYFDPFKGTGLGVKSFGWNGLALFMEPDCL